MLRGPHPRAVVVEEMLRRGARVEPSREILSNQALRHAVRGDEAWWVGGVQAFSSVGRSADVECSVWVRGHAYSSV